MTKARPTLPLIRDTADANGYHSLIEGRANANLFGGWGVRLSTWQMF